MALKDPRFSSIDGRISRLRMEYKIKILSSTADDLVRCQEIEEMINTLLDSRIYIRDKK